MIRKARCSTFLVSKRHERRDLRLLWSVIEFDPAFDLVGILSNRITHGRTAVAVPGDELGVRQRRATGQQGGRLDWAGGRSDQTWGALLPDGFIICENVFTPAIML